MAAESNTVVRRITIGNSKYVFFLFVFAAIFLAGLYVAYPTEAAFSVNAIAMSTIPRMTLSSKSSS